MLVQLRMLPFSHVYCRRARAPIDTTINGGSANGGAIVWWHSTTGLSVQVGRKHDIYAPSRRSRAVPCDPATLVPPREGARPEHETKQPKQQEQLRIYAILRRQEPTTSANRSKSCPRDPSSRLITAPKTHFSSDPNQISKYILDSRVPSSILRK